GGAGWRLPGVPAAASSPGHRLGRWISGPGPQRGPGSTGSFQRVRSGTSLQVLTSLPVLSRHPVLRGGSAATRSRYPTPCPRLGGDSASCLGCLADDECLLVGGVDREVAARAAV